MLTYQDYLKINNESEDARMNFARQVITNYQSSDMYKNALLGHNYYRVEDTTMLRFQKFLYEFTGEQVPDTISANYKCVTNIFYRFATLTTSYLLSNGVSFKDPETKKKLGGSDFDVKVFNTALKAYWGGVAYGFFNLDHIEVFDDLEFAPLIDEVDGSIKAGVRFWQIDATKPLRFTLYDLDGYTEYIEDDDGMRVLHEKRTYKEIVRSSEASGEEIIDGENYPSFPIVPLWSNREKKHEIKNLQNGIDCYEIIKSGFANDVDEASQIYWIINNAGGMDDAALARFIKRIKQQKAAVVDESGGSTAEAHTMEVPYAAREAILERLERDLYKDAMVLDTRNIYGGDVRATAIAAAYDEMDKKADDFEICVTTFIKCLLALIGVDDDPSYTRSKVINKTEEIDILLKSAEYLSKDYITKKILTILGDIDQLDDVMENMGKDEMSRIE